MTYTSQQAERSSPVGGLKELRREAGLSRQKLADRAGCSAHLLLLIENGYTCSPDMARRIADALGVQPDDLWPRIPDRRPDHVEVLRRDTLADDRERLIVQAGDIQITALGWVDENGRPHFALERVEGTA